MLCAIVFTERLHLLNAPLHGDICAYAVIGHEMTHGRQLYSDLWERKPPLLYASFAVAEWVVGYGPRQIFFLATTTAIVSLWLIYLAAASGGRGRLAGLLAAAAWALLNCDLDLTANQPDPEAMINVFLIAAFYLSTKKGISNAILLGVCCAAATLYKHNIAIACGTLLLAHAMLRNGRSWKQSFGQAIIAGTIILLVWAGMFAYFSATGRGGDLVEVLFRQNVSYSGSLINNLGKSTTLRHLFPAFMIWSLAPALVAGLWLSFCLARQRSRFRPTTPWVHLFAWSIGIWLSIGVTGYIFSHYYQLWIPVGCIGLGWSAAELLNPQNKVAGIIAYTSVALAFLFLIVRQASEFQLTPTQWVQHQFGYYDVLAQNQMGQSLKSLLRPDEQFWELGQDNSLYFLSAHSPPSGLLFIDPLIYGAHTRPYCDRLLNDLNHTRPILVVISDDWTPFFPPSLPNSRRISAWIAENYVPMNSSVGWPHYQLFARRGSRLDQRH